MESIELKNIDSDDIDDMLIKVEDSFGIKFSNDDFSHVQTFGELCDQIKSKIQLDQMDDCTTQQAYYKLRSAIETVLHLDKGILTPESSLTELLPRKTRNTETKKIENELGLKLSILRPPHYITNLLVLLLIASFIGLFINWQYGLAGLALAFGGLWLAFKTANELDLRTVGQLAEKMTRENYLKSRRITMTYNEKEIEKVLIDWFSNDLGLDKSKLTRDARLA